MDLTKVTATAGAVGGVVGGVVELDESLSVCTRNSYQRSRNATSKVPVTGTYGHDIGT